MSDVGRAKPGVAGTVMAGPKELGVNPQGSKTGTGLWEVGTIRDGLSSSTGPRSLGFSWRDGQR